MTLLFPILALLLIVSSLSCDFAAAAAAAAESDKGAAAAAEPLRGNITYSSNSFHTTFSSSSSNTDFTRTILTLPDGEILVDRVLSSNSTAAWYRARGIPYALPPVGPLRFQPPVPRSKWNGVLNATSFGLECINEPLFNRVIGIGLRPQGEACLFLNVYAPIPSADADAGAAYANGGAANVTSAKMGNKKTKKKEEEEEEEEEKKKQKKMLLPILFWIHGGSFAYGGSAGYSGDRVYLHRRDAIIVTLNYRVGALGFLGGAAVAATTTDGSAGNFGLQDIRVALEWTRRNALAFGGDAQRITIFGESAGASLVACHLVSPRSSGLFHGAIMQSGAFDNYTVQADAEASFDAFAQVSGCYHSNHHHGGGGGGGGGDVGDGDGGDEEGDGGGGGGGGGDDDAAALRCLREKPLSQLLSAIGNTSADGWFSPVVDNVELTGSPEDLARAGRINSAPGGVILGTNLNEGRLLMPVTIPVPNAPVSTADDVRKWVETNYPPPAYDPNAIMDEYAAEIHASPWRAAAQMYTESQYFCPTAQSARWLLRANAAPRDRVFVYRLAHAPAIMELVGDVLFWYQWCPSIEICANATRFKLGVGHASDVPLLWNSELLEPGADQRVAATMIDLWQTFAAGGGGGGSFSGASGGGVTEEEVKWPPFAPKNATLVLNADADKVALNLLTLRCSKVWRRE